MQGGGQKIFFSYSRDDSKFVLKLAEDMKAKGLDVWIDQLNIPSGAHWDQTVEEALKNCPSFLLVLSPTSIASQNVMDEVGYAIERKKRIIPVLYRHCEIPFRIKRLQYIDFTGDYETALARSVQALGGSSASVSEPSSGHSSTVRRPAGSKVRLIAGALGIVIVGLGLYFLAGDRSSKSTAADTGTPAKTSDEASTQARAPQPASPPVPKSGGDAQPIKPVANPTETNPAPANPPPASPAPATPAPAPGTGTVIIPAPAPGPNLLAVDQGGKLVGAPTDDWSAANDGDLKNSNLVPSRMGAVFGFKDDKPATFNQFGYLVLESGYTPESIEIAVADTPSGPFRVAGIVKPQDLKVTATDGWQYFTLPPTTARYVKITFNDSPGGVQAGRLTELGLYFKAP